MKKIILILFFMSCWLYSFEVKFGITKDFYEFRDDNEYIGKDRFIYLSLPEKMP